jgi:hypothetical protein
MFNLVDFYSKENQPIRSSYEESIQRIEEIKNKTENYNDFGDKKEYFRFLNLTSKLILQFNAYEKALTIDYFESKTFDELLRENNGFYKEVLPKHYGSSYANPSYCVKLFGDKFGQLISYFYTLYRGYIEFSFQHKVFKMVEYNKLFIKVYEYIKNENVEYETLKSLMTSIQRKEKIRENFYRFKTEYDKDFRYYTDIIEKSDFTDLRYIFKAGKYISENEIKTVEFLIKYPDEKINQIAKEIVKAYIRGFERDSKDISKKSTIGFVYKIGLEKLYKAVIREFREIGLETVIHAPYSSDTNKQYQYDHKFDIGLYISEEFINIMADSLKKGLDKNKEILSEYSGILFFEKFGDKPFSPESKKEIIKLGPEQQKLYQTYLNQYHIILDSFTPRAETSFCIVAFPTPEIRGNFEEIFEDTVELNMLDSDKYEKIQQIMIDVMDQADTVHVKGKGGNKTDIIVKMQPISDPKTETNFLNSGASVNIPVGEIFTSPQLSGTNGVLHTELAYLNWMRYDNLTLTFKDGYIEDYSCTNFDSEEQNKKYIEENLLFPHKTLPIGEFAIGTNTKAYVASRKHQIMDVLPVLIIEKTGPHFAVGDTCFSRQEDQKKYNLFNNKLITAVDNEKSIQRKTDINEAYCNKHHDITLAFDSLGFITAVKENGEKIEIIKDGRFALKGTEELNEPLDGI